MSRPTLPGTIPGLLRRGSPIVWPDDGLRGVVVCPSPNGTAASLVNWSDDSDAGHITQEAEHQHIALDLTDPTGRAHAAWWLAARLDAAEAAFAALDDVRCVTGRSALPYIMEPAAFGDDLRDEVVDLLRRVVLAVAGLEVIRGA